MNTYRTGDAIALDATLQLKGVPDPGLAGVPVVAALATAAGVLVPGSTVSATVDPATSRATATIPAAATAGLEPGPYLIVFKGTFAQGGMHYEPVTIALLPGIIP